ncbi:MAG TPA: hypothetical protein VGS80_05465 [Ktedonobacterales bacterium]|nr:hypothetical protein [Ktedonobacterales bacterium]
MNSIMADTYPTFELYQALRDQLMAILSDDDLAYQPGGATPALGALCRDIGETEIAYTQSFQTFELAFTSGSSDPGLGRNVAALTSWYAELDRDLKAAVAALAEDDVAGRMIDRGGDFKLSPQGQLDAYKEALLIFYGKVDVYLKALNKTLPDQWRDWIG